MPTPPRSGRQSRTIKAPSKSDILLAHVEKTTRVCGTTSPHGTELVGFQVSDSQTGLLENQQTFPVDRRLAKHYTDAKLSEGAYNMFSIARIEDLQGDLEPLFARWRCDGPEFDRFIEGILKS